MARKPLGKIRFKEVAKSGRNDRDAGVTPNAPRSLWPLAHRVSGGEYSDSSALGRLESLGLKVGKIAERQKASGTKAARSVSHRLQPEELELIEKFRKATGSHGPNHFAQVCFRIGLATFVQLEKEGAL